MTKINLFGLIPNTDNRFNVDPNMLGVLLYQIDSIVKSTDDACKELNIPLPSQSYTIGSIILALETMRLYEGKLEFPNNGSYQFRSNYLGNNEGIFRLSILQDTDVPLPKISLRTIVKTPSKENVDASICGFLSCLYKVLKLCLSVSDFNPQPSEGTQIQVFDNIEYISGLEPAAINQGYKLDDKVQKVLKGEPLIQH